MSQAPDQIEYINRETGEREIEVVYGGNELHQLYHLWWGVALRPLLVRLPVFSHINGQTKRSKSSRNLIHDFVDQYEVNTDEMVGTVDDYATLDDLFTRRLKPEARPIDPNPGHVVSPADGRVLVYENLGQQPLVIKGNHLEPADLLPRARDFSPYVGGTLVIVRLAPKDYHRFHFPVDGSIESTRRMGGPLESVHPIALAGGAKIFKNKRTLTKLKAAWGPIWMAEIGALLVGTIVQSHPGGGFKRGDEKGYFRFGGSTVTLMWGPKGPKADPDLVEASQNGTEMLVKMGTCIAKIA